MHARAKPLCCNPSLNDQALMHGCHVASMPWLEHACSEPSCIASETDNDTILASLGEWPADRTPCLTLSSWLLFRNSALTQCSMCVQVVRASQQHSKGCNCRKSRCLKKYCECFQNGVQCTEACRCFTLCPFDTYSAEYWTGNSKKYTALPQGHLVCIRTTTQAVVRIYTHTCQVSQSQVCCEEQRDSCVLDETSRM